MKFCLSPARFDPGQKETWGEFAAVIVIQFDLNLGGNAAKSCLPPL